MRNDAVILSFSRAENSDAGIGPRVPRGNDAGAQRFFARRRQEFESHVLEKSMQVVAHIEDRRRNRFQSGRPKHLKTCPHAIDARHVENSGFVSLSGFVKLHRLLRKKLR